jgi:hypothetical protein
MAHLPNLSGSSPNIGGSAGTVTDWTRHIVKVSERSIGEGYFGQVYQARLENLPEEYTDTPLLAVKVLYEYRLEPPNAYRVSCHVFSLKAHSIASTPGI